MRLTVTNTEEFGASTLTISLHLVVSRGEVYATERPNRHTLRREDRLPLGHALKLARRLGVEDVLREALEQQARERHAHAKAEREHALSAHAKAMARATADDAEAARVLAALDVLP